MKANLYLFFVTCICLVYQSSAAQNVLFDKEIRLTRGWKEKREAYPVSDHLTNNTTLFLVDKQSINALVFDDQFVLVDSLESERPEGAFQEIIGGSYDQATTNVFFATKNKRSLASVSLNLETKNVTHSKIDLPLKKERYAGSVSYRGKFYFLTTTKASSQLNLYIFYDHQHYDVVRYDFSHEVFNDPPFPSTLFDILLTSELMTIDLEAPNSIEVVAKKNKLYCYDNKILISLDNQLTRTALITISLSTLESELSFFEQPYMDCGQTVNATSNSFVHRDKLYQFSACPWGMSFAIKDVVSGNELKTFSVGKEEEISFKNTPILQEGGSTTYAQGSERELSKTKQFLRKVSAAQAGVSVCETSSGIEVTLGGHKEIAVTSGGGPIMSAGPMGTVTYNPTHGAFSTYTLSKAVHFKSVLDPSTFEHRPVVLSDNAFDKIRTFMKQDESFTAETIFRRSESFILGYYFKPERRYILRQFSH